MTSWLTSEGFTVNGVYPNKMQIDFSGTASQVDQAFHTQETIYTLTMAVITSPTPPISACRRRCRLSWQAWWD